MSPDPIQLNPATPATTNIDLKDLDPTTAPLDIKKAVEDSLSTLVPNDKKGVLFGFAGSHGAQVGTAFRIGDNWQVSGGMDFEQHQGKTEFAGTVGAIFTW
jgi:hypothetical protein